MEQGNEKATEVIHFRATRRQRDAIERLALAERRNVSEWLRLKLEGVIDEEPDHLDPGSPRGARR